jgi:5-formyltetrahydrofolate cyclo-ligase
VSDDAKAHARKAAFERRALAHAQGRGAAASEYLRHFLGPWRSLVIAGYLPMRDEIDPLPAMKSLVLDGPVCVPVVIGKGMALEFRRWTPDAKLVPSVLGTSIPETGETLTPDVLIVPLLAYDKAFFRLGYGGGFYDRTIAGLRAAGRVYCVGLAYEAQFDRNLPVGPYDQALDAIVTEQGVQTRKGDA